MLAALGIVGAGFSLDMFSRDAGPQSAVARSGPAQPRAAEPGPEATANVQELLSALGAMPPAMSTSGLRDLFTIDARLSTLWETPTPDEATAPAAATQPAGEPFERRHTLQGIIAGRRAVAIIDGLYLTVGQELDGYRLIEIHRNRVVFGRERERAELRLNLRGSVQP